MPLDDLADELSAARLTVASRGYSTAEVDELFAGAATAIRMAEDAPALAAVADDLERAQFTPVAGGYDAFAVRGMITRVATELRAAARVRSGPDGGGTAAAEAADVDRELDRLAGFEHELADRLARVAPGRTRGANEREPTAAELADELARLHEEIRIAGTALRDLVRQVAQLRKRARDEVEQEIAELRASRLAELDRETTADHREG